MSAESGSGSQYTDTSFVNIGVLNLGEGNITMGDSSVTGNVENHGTGKIDLGGSEVTGEIIGKNIWDGGQEVGRPVTAAEQMQVGGISNAMKKVAADLSDGANIGRVIATNVGSALFVRDGETVTVQGQAFGSGATVNNPRPKA